MVLAFIYQQIGLKTSLTQSAAGATQETLKERFLITYPEEIVQHFHEYM
jgi:hypothetical protein